MPLIKTINAELVEQPLEELSSDQLIGKYKEVYREYEGEEIRVNRSGGWYTIGHQRGFRKSDVIQRIRRMRSGMEDKKAERLLAQYSYDKSFKACEFITVRETYTLTSYRFRVSHDHKRISVDASCTLDRRTCQWSELFATYYGSTMYTLDIKGSTEVKLFYDVVWNLITTWNKTHTPISEQTEVVEEGS